MLDRIVSRDDRSAAKWRACFRRKSGRNTAHACETNAIETNMIAAAHFMSRGLIKLQKKRNKKILAWSWIRFETLKKHWIDLASEATFQFPILRFRAIFPADATVDSENCRLNFESGTFGLFTMRLAT